MAKQSKSKNTLKSPLVSKLLSPRVLVPVIFAIVGTVLIYNVYAAPPGGPKGHGSGGGSTTTTDPSASSAVKLYFSPWTATVSSNTVIQQEVRVNTQNKSANAVEADFSYPSNLLQFMSIDTSKSAYSLSLIQEGGDGKVRIVRGNSTGLTGDQLVGTVSFKVLGSKGKADLAFLSSSSVASSETNTEILEASFGASLRLSR